MKKIFKQSAILLVALMFAACQNQSSKTAEEAAPSLESPAGIKGVVVTTMNSGNYTYVEIDKGGEKMWAAGPKTPVKTGDTVILADGSMMNNFYAKSLDRTFEVILFSGGIIVEGSQAAAGATETAAEMAPPGPITADAPSKGSITKAKGGYTIDELFAKKADLNGKTIDIRGKVVKANSGIMGTNWYHLQDGSGKEGTNDIVVTSAQDIEAGKIVLAKGKLTVDKDFGSGYKYDVIVEEASITVE